MEFQHGPREGCPGLETLAAYADGALDAGQREAVAAHLSTCEDCYEMFVETARFRQEEEAKAAAPGAVLAGRWPARRRWAAGLASLAAAGLVGFAIFGPGLPDRGGRSPAFRELVKAVGPTRPIEPRLVGGFAWGPIRPVARAGSARPEEPWQVLAAAARIKQDNPRDASGPRLAELAAAHLVLHETDEAIRLLEDAAGREPRDARIWNDVAAAYLVRGAGRDEAADRARSLDAAARAVELRPDLVEALFNKALALESLSLRTQAESVWNEYLKLDGASPWADEARRHLATLSKRGESGAWGARRQEWLAAASTPGARVPALAVEELTQQVRGLLDEDALSRWASAEEAGSGAADSILSASRSLALEYRATSGDALPLRVLEHLAGLSRPDRRELALQVVRLAAARTLRRKERLTEARDLAERSREALGRLGSPLAPAVDYELASAADDAGFAAEARMAYGRVAAACRAAGFTVVEGRAEWALGLMDARDGDSTAAIGHFMRSQILMRGARYRQGVAALDSMIAAEFESLGETRAAWRFRLDALEGLEYVTSPLRRHTLLTNVAVTLLEDGLPYAARTFQDAVVRGLGAVTNPSARAYASAFRSRIRLALGDVEGARRDVAEGEARLEEIPDEARREFPALALAVAKGEAGLKSDARLSEASLAQAIRGFTAKQARFGVPRLRLLRARALAKLGRTDEAMDEIGAGIAEVERGRPGARAAAPAYLDASWDLYAEGMRLEFDLRGRPEAALAFVERFRARYLLDALADGVRAEPLSISEIRSRLDPETNLVYYVKSDDRLFSWVVSRTGVDASVQPDLRRDVARLSAEIRRGLQSGSLASGALAELSPRLLDPAAGALRPGTTVVFVLDADLEGLPLSALQTAGRRALFEDHPVVIAASGSAFVQVSRFWASRPRTPASERVVVVGNPAAAPDSAIDLEALPGAEREARAIASVYGKAAVLLTGPEARISRVLGALKTAELLHFAGHSQADRRRPGESRLFLAPEAGGADLKVSQMETGRFCSLRVVVLAACSSGVGVTLRSEGTQSIARALMAAGVPSVVASLGPTSDGETLEFFRVFYEGLREGLPPARALQASRIEARRARGGISQGIPPWANFELFGIAGV